MKIKTPRFKISSRNKSFYSPVKGGAAGVVDSYGRVYATEPSGAIRLIKDVVTGPDDPRRGLK